MRKVILLLAAQVFVCAVIVQAQEQDAPSLGDVARHSRMQKQQKDAQAKDAAKPGQATDAASKPASKTSHVITNEDLPAHSTSPTTMLEKSKTSDMEEPLPAGNNRDEMAQELKSRIQGQKSEIDGLKNQISSLSDSIRYVGGECVANCAQWNERQQQKQQEVERLKSQLDDAQHRLDELQDAAHKQGFGSSISDPE